MVCKAAWIPARGTVLVGESNDPFNPTEGNLSFTPMTPTEQAGEDAEKGPSPAATTFTELVKQHSTPLESVLNIASLCNVAKVFQGDDGWAARGDPTECAIQVFAHRFEWGRESLTEGDSPKWGECFPSLLSR
jgi:P-type Na+/K+ transporter